MSRLNKQTQVAIELGIYLYLNTPKRGVQQCAADALELCKISRCVWRSCEFGTRNINNYRRPFMEMASLHKRAAAVLQHYTGLIGRIGGDPRKGVTTNTETDHPCAGSCMGIEGLPQNWIIPKEHSLP